MNLNQTNHNRAVLRDLAIIVGTVIGFYSLAVHLDLSEKVSEFTLGYERWQFDELPLTLLLLSLGLSWFAFRRVRETRRELTERMRAQQRVAELLAQNRDLSQSLILVQENERRVLARELHDEFGQYCTAIRAEASYILHAPVSETVSGSARRIGLAAEALYAGVRDMLKRLRPLALDSLGIESALQELCESWEVQTGIACGFFPGDVPENLDDSKSIALFRLVQEALTNVARHAEASQVRISLNSADGYLNLTIEDDGCGLSQPEGLHQGFGLAGMRERVAALQGDIDFFSEPGLRIVVRLPLEIAS